MKKKVLTSLLAMGVLFCCFTVQAEAREACSHSYDKIEVDRTSTGGYNHTYTYEVRCSKCGHVSETGSGTFESHSTDHT